MDKSFYTEMILVDLQKALDTLDQIVFMQKNSMSVVKWFQSYLLNREFFVTQENFFLVSGLINCGVQQGSILGRCSS